MNNWNHIESEEDVVSIIEKSVDHPQIIFKDSTSCGISAFAKERLAFGTEDLMTKANLHYLNLLRFRSASNLIAETLRVMHQSPQVIVVKNKVPVYVVTHGGINSERIINEI